MKMFVYFLSIVFVSILCMQCLQAQDAVTVETIWERSLANGNLPAWFGGDTERGIGYGVVDNLERVYVASRGDGDRIRIIDADSGEDAGYLDMTGVSGGHFSINDVDVSDDGIVFASNMTLGAVNDPFRIYMWTTELFEPEEVITYSDENYRLGDKITVVGSVDDNSLTIYAAASRSNKILRFTTEDNADSFDVEEITLSDISDAGIHPSVGPTAPGDDAPFFYNASGEEHGVGIRPRFYEADGTHQATMPGNQFLNTNSIRYLKTEWDDEYIITFRDNVDEQYAVIFALGDGAGEADSVAVTPDLGDAFNTHESGDVAIRHNDDGTYTLYVQAANNGIGAYKLTFIGLNVDESDRAGVPDDFRLFQNYPNPFNPVTTIEFSIPREEHVCLTVYDVLGRQVAELYNDRIAAGNYRVAFDASSLPSGMYLYRLETSSYSEMKRMIYMK